MKYCFQILFARAEGLHAHGHTQEACRLAKQLAEEMLNNPPDLSQETPPQTAKGRVSNIPQPFFKIILVLSLQNHKIKTSLMVLITEQRTHKFWNSLRVLLRSRVWV